MKKYTATTTALGSLKQPVTLIALVGILMIAILTVRRVKGALLLEIFVTASLGWLSGVAPWPEKIIDIPQLPFTLFGQAIVGSQYLTWAQLGNFVAAVFVLLFVCLADTIDISRKDCRDTTCCVHTRVSLLPSL